MPTTELTEFREMVWRDPALQARLYDVENPREFVELVIKLAAERGAALTAEELAEEMRAGQRAWLERWI